MINIPKMVMIGGNSRNSGKTTLACKIIRKLALNHEVVALKVSSIRPGEADFHGDHNEEEVTAGFTIFEELNNESDKDTSKMLRAGATHVYYIRVEDMYIDQAILHFLSRFINNEILVCESRSLREYVNPGLFLMRVRSDRGNTAKDVSEYLAQADKVFFFNENKTEIYQYADSLNYENKKFILTNNG